MKLELLKELVAKEQHAILILVIALIVAVIWVGLEVQRLHATIEPLATSRLANALSGGGT